MKRINDLLNNKYDNHVMPFLWMHGEEEATIRMYMKEIESAGIKSVCIESRPHEDFLKDKWWQDVSIIIDECEKRDMTVWILDDKHFPTGYAAGEIQSHHKKLQKEFLSFTKLDFVGPKKNAGVILDWVMASSRPNIMNVGVEENEQSEIDFVSEVVTIVAAKKDGHKGIHEKSLINLTSFVKENTLYWDFPPGEWSVYVFYTTQEGGELATEGYLNPLVPEATDILIETVYQAHYDHFKDSFGKVIKGFFSDEPRFGNTKGPNAIIGKVEMPLPWVHGLHYQLAERLGWSFDETLLKLPLLSTGDSDIAYEMRYQYMDMVTDMYSQNFSKRIGDWCKNHGVEYIGHVIEDNNAHSRLGYGAGHFFKSMAGQDMAGIDVVLHQLAPQQNNGYFDSFTSTGWDGEFFHYALGKMGASLGSLDKRKQGRTMCEVFGAYGWSEGIKMMKWIADHMLVRGINYFVPHAFTMKDFPDSDCPPHFYAHGKNPQFKYFHYLMDYMNKLSFLFSEGQHQSDIAVLYNAEAEWSGESMLIQKVTRVLTENQFEFDIVSADMVVESNVSTLGTFSINKHSFKVLIIPYAEKLPEKTIIKLTQLLHNNVQVIFINGCVEKASENVPVKDEIDCLNKMSEIASLSNLSKLLHVKTKADCLITNQVFPYLRYFHYEQEGKSIYMLFNENTSEDIQLSAQFLKAENLKIYDPILNLTRGIRKENDWYKLTLSRGESLIIFESDQPNSDEALVTNFRKETECLEANDWKIAFCNQDIEKTIHSNQLPLIGIGDEFETYSGTIVYETKINGGKKSAVLEIEEASEIVSVYVDDVFVGTRISYPYHFDIGNKLEHESAVLKIEVTNNLGRQMRDYLSQFILLEPLGITGSIKINYN